MNRSRSSRPRYGASMSVGRGIAGAGVWALVGALTGVGSPAMAARGDGDGLYGMGQAGYTHVLVAPSGQDDIQGNDPGARLRDAEGLLTLQLIGGTRGVLYDGLRTHLSAQFLLDPNGPPTGGAVSAWPAITQDESNDGQLLALHLAFAELDGLTDRGALADVSLRAGRQFHWGPIPLTFDGITVGYDDGRMGLAVRGGKRSAVYDPDPGDLEFVGGVSGWYHTGRRLGLRIGAEYLYHSRQLQVIERDRLLVPSLVVDESVHLGEVTIAYLPDRSWSMNLSSAFANGGVDGIEAEVGYSAESFDLYVRGRQEVGDGLTYDLALGLSPRFSERTTTYETHRLTLPDPGVYTDVDISSQWFLSPSTVFTAGVGGRRVFADRLLTVYDTNHTRWSAGLGQTVPIGPGSGLELRVGYSGTAYSRDDRDPTLAFADATVGGDVGSHLIDASVRYVRGRRQIGGRLLAGRTLTVGLRGYAERWTLGNRFIRDVDESAFGLAADLSASLTDHWSVSAGYEISRDTTVLSEWLAPLHGLRAGIRGTL